MITVFYDGKCGLCRCEIRHYQKVAPKDVFNWQDITADASSLERLGITYVNGLKRLHAVDAQGKLHIGMDAFILIWRQIPRWSILAKFLGLPVIYSFSTMAYHRFADWRFRRLKHCQIAE